MKNLPIHPNQWSAFCEAFTQLNRGTLMTLELYHLDNKRDEVVRDSMFQKMTLDTGDACNNMMTLSFGQEGEPRMNHIVIEPIHLRIKQNGDGQKLLQIEAENGVTLVTFHSGRLPVEEFKSEFADFGKGRKERVTPS